MYCLVASERRPSLSHVPGGLAGTGAVRLLDASGPASASARRRRGQATQWLVVANAPLDRFGEAAINARLSDLDWVARAAVAHEGVVEAFTGAPAVLPMKLFTIFTSDDRALDHVRSDAPRIDALLRRVARHHEWGVRIMLDPASIRTPARRSAAASKVESGRGFLSRKKSQRDDAVERARRARQTVAAVYDRLAARATLARRRMASQLPVRGGPLLLDAAFLVKAASSSRFRGLAARESKALAPNGYRLTLTGPWPPYSFVQE